jgi:hypothetical protein
MALIPHLRRLPARICRCVESGEPRSKSLAGGTIHEWAWPPKFRMRPCVALWQQPGGRGLADSRKRPLAAGTSDSATNYLLGALGRRPCRKRTPGPPPFSSMNSTPAASRARRTAKSLAVVIDVLSSASSARLIVASPNAASRASSAALHRRRARAARIWALFNGFGFMVDQEGIV